MRVSASVGRFSSKRGINLRRTEEPGSRCHHFSKIQRAYADVAGKKIIDIVQPTLLDHGFRPAAPFFGRLEYKRKPAI